MTPEERSLLERALKLGEANNKILKKLERRMRWTAAWGFIKFLLIVIPLVVGFLYLEPYVKSLVPLYNTAQSIINGTYTPH